MTRGFDFQTIRKGRLAGGRGRGRRSKSRRTSKTEHYEGDGAAVVAAGPLKAAGGVTTAFGDGAHEPGADIS